jgi:CheY-like chemotaxis protein
MVPVTRESSPRAPVELLLVEDSFGDAALAREAFAGAKLANHLLIAADGEEALRALNAMDRPRPDLILLDLNLPRMSGLEVLKAIKASPSLREIPVVVLTGSDASADVRESYALGANAYIVKPVHFERLEEIVTALERFWFDIAALPTHPLGVARPC